MLMRRRNGLNWNTALALEPIGCTQSTLADEEPRRQAERFGQGKEGGQGIVGMRAKPVGAVDGGERAVRSELRGQRLGGGGQCQG